MTSIVWFRNDLRTHDNEALFRAARAGGFVLPVFCFDPRQFGTTALGFPKTGAFRAKFLLESVADLRTSLLALGADLVIRTGKPEDILPQLAQEHGATALYFHEEATDEELRVEDAVCKRMKSLGVAVHSFWGATLYHLDDLPFGMDRLPDVFTTFRKQVEKVCSVRPAFPAPAPHSLTLPATLTNSGAQANEHSFSLPALPEIVLAALCETNANEPTESRGVLCFKGGETTGLARLHEYIWAGDHLKSYKETRNGLLGADYSSKFSAWLAAGCLSPRVIYEEVKRYESERVSNDSTYWLVFELLWRDFFRFVAFAWGNQLFFEGGIRNVPQTRIQSWSKNWDVFERWKQGMTGVPFIDANMRELATTGFMSNRGRQNVASYLVHDARQHWHLGAEWFESVLVDYDVCSNYGNWNYAAGIGNDPREDRTFNIVRQAGMYDPKGEYVRHWLPELRSLPAHFVHEPHTMNAAEQSRFGCRIGSDYPKPIVDFAR